jgi:UDP-N-acetylenolpyruvoylglucosamine reductase
LNTDCSNSNDCPEAPSPGGRAEDCSPYLGGGVDWRDELVRRLSSSCRIRRDEPLAVRTTLRVGGPADLFVEPAGEADLVIILKFCAEHRLPKFVLGRGSNLLVKDGGIRGLVLSLAHPEFARISVDGFALRCGAGARLKNVSHEARRHNLTGLEFMEGIPGSVGGALRMNAGAMGSWTFDVLQSLRVVSDEGDVRELPARQVPVEYRSCPLLRTQIALEAVFRGAPAERMGIDARMKSFSQKRWSSQPAAPSAGCIFKNPAIGPAGKLIDELGLKGARVGGASVSVEHGNFIVNTGNATARDVLDLIELLRARVRDERGIELETEVEIVGEECLKN